MTEISPYQHYENSKNSALLFTSEVINSNSGLKKEKLNELYEKLKDTDTITKAISVLQKIHDKRNNIHWFIDGETLVRDGREAKDPPLPTTEAYIIQYLNHVRAAISVIHDITLQKELEKDALSRMLSLMETKEVKQIQSLVKNANTDLALKLLKKKIKIPDEKIRLAKDFSNFQDKHYNVITLSKFEDKTIIEADIRLCSLTPSQKLMFSHIHKYSSSNSKERMHIEVDGENMDWFNNLTRWKQNLVKQYSKDILDENHVIPTQLRNILPLLRNSYAKTTAIQLASGDVEEILETRHAGSISTGIKGNNVSSTIENIRQLRQSSPSASALHLNALLSPINIFDADASDDLTTKKALSLMAGAKKTTLPFNFLRKFFGGGVDLDGIASVLNEISKEFSSELPNFSALLTTLDPKLLTESKNEISKITNRAKKQTLSLALDIAKDLIDSQKINMFSKDIENLNSRLSINLKLLSYNANKGHLGNNLKSIPIVVTYCKSGKDRTQIIEVGTTIKAVQKHLRISQESPRFIDFVKCILKAQHAPSIAGMQGGSIGCYGVKSTTTMDGSYSVFKDVISYISPKSANFNRFKVGNKLRIEKAKDQMRVVTKNLHKFFMKSSSSKEENLVVNSIRSAPSSMVR